MNMSAILMRVALDDGVSQVWMPHEMSSMNSEPLHTRSTLVKHPREAEASYISLLEVLTTEPVS